MNEEAWYVIELKGRRRCAGHLSEMDWCGTKWVRIESPLPDWACHAQTYHPSALYSFREAPEAEARELLRQWEGL